MAFSLTADRVFFHDFRKAAVSRRRRSRPDVSRRSHSRARLVFTRLEAPGWSSPRGAMVKAYLRYEQARAFGVIASPEACPVYADEKGKLVVTAALERLAVWDVRRGVEHQSLIPPARESGLVPAVTKIARAPGSSLVAAGAADGSIRLWNLEDGTSDVLLKGHKSEVTALRFNASGSLLVSGGKDTNVVVWDVVAEMGLCRLRGHKTRSRTPCSSRRRRTRAARQPKPPRRTERGW